MDFNGLLDQLTRGIQKGVGNTVFPQMADKGGSRGRIGDFLAEKYYTPPIQSPVGSTLPNQYVPQGVYGAQDINVNQPGISVGNRGNSVAYNPNKPSTLGAGMDIPSGEQMADQEMKSFAETFGGSGKTLGVQATPTPTPADFDSVVQMAKSASPMAPSPTPPPDAAALPYYEQINQAAAENDIPQDIFYRMLRKESMGFNPHVIKGNLDSPVGAQGIAQFMPSTSAGMGFDPLNPDEAIPVSAKYLRAKYDEGGDDWKLALARYNAGSGNVRKYGGVPPFKETQNYVADILRGLEL